MIRFTLTATLALLCALAAAAQERNPVFALRVNDLEYAAPATSHSAGQVIGTVLEALAGEAVNSDNSHYAPAVNGAVRSALSAVRRFAPVSQGAVAQFDISGQITSISMRTSAHSTEHKDSKGKPYTVIDNTYQATIGATLTLRDLDSGQEWTNTFTAATEWYEADNTEALAFERALNRLQRQVTDTYNAMFPLQAEIVEAGQAKKDKQKDVYIDLGEADAVVRGMHFDVFELSQVAGRETRRRLGRLKVEETLGADISRCKVDKGAKEIKAALDAGQTLLITSAD